MKIRMTLACVAAVAALSCAAPPPPPVPPVDTSVENAGLDIILASTPDGLRVSANEGANLELRPSEEGVDGRIWFSVGPDEHSVNLVAAVDDHRAYLEGTLGGDYKGAQELMGDFGVAFYSRGEFEENGSAVEETVVFLIHPRANRLLEIHYAYPAAAGDSAARVEKLIEVLAELR